MSVKPTLIAALLSLSVSGCFCLPNPACCNMGPACPPLSAPMMGATRGPACGPPMMSMMPAPWTCDPAPVYQPVSMTLAGPDCQQTRQRRTRQQRTLKDRCGVQDYYSPVMPVRYRPVRQKRTTIKDVFKDRIAWGKPKWERDPYPGVVKDPPRCNCEKCRRKRACGCGQCATCRESDCAAPGDVCGVEMDNCAVPSRVWTSDWDECAPAMSGQPFEVCGEGCNEYEILTSMGPPRTVSVEKPKAIPETTLPETSETSTREFHAPLSADQASVPPPAPIPPPEEDLPVEPPPTDPLPAAAGSGDEKPTPIDPPPTGELPAVDLTDPLPEEASSGTGDERSSDDTGGSDIEQTSLAVPLLDFSTFAPVVNGDSKDTAETSTMAPTSVLRRRIQ